MISAALVLGNELGELTLSVANVVVEDSAAPEHLPSGDYVAVTVRGAGRWGRDLTWWSGAEISRTPPLCLVTPAAERADARLAYVRDLGTGGSVTILYAGRQPSDP
jgi:hypothetical protein